MILYASLPRIYPFQIPHPSLSSTPHENLHKTFFSYTVEIVGIIFIRTTNIGRVDLIFIVYINDNKTLTSHYSEKADPPGKN